MMLARVLTGSFGLISLIGLIWFGNSIEKIPIFATLTSIVAAFVVSLIPEKLLNNKKNAVIVILFSIVGIGALSTVVVYDFATYGYSSGVIYRLIFIYGFSLMAMQVWGTHVRRNANP